MTIQTIKTALLFVALFSLFTLNSNAQNPIKVYDKNWEEGGRLY